MKHEPADMDLYEGHTIKEEAGIVIGPTVLQESYNKPPDESRQVGEDNKLRMSIEIPLYRVDTLEFWQRHAKLNSVDLSKVDLTGHMLYPTLQGDKSWETNLNLAWPPMKYEFYDKWNQVAIKLEPGIDLPCSDAHRNTEKMVIDEKHKLAENVPVTRKKYLKGVSEAALEKKFTDKTDRTNNGKANKSECRIKRKNVSKELSHNQKTAPKNVNFLKKHDQLNFVRYICDTCDKQITNKEVFSTHIKTQDKKTYYCDICDKAFKKRYSVVRHILEQHDLTSCNKCKQKLEEKLKDNLKKHICGTCNEHFIRENDLRRHTESKHILIEHTSQQQIKIEHYDNHLNSSKKMLVCDTCKKQFKKKPDVRRHIISMHTEKTLSCNKCKMMFNNKYAFVQHSLQHKLDKKKPKVYDRLYKYACDKCNKKCKRKEQMRRHMKIHTKITFSCEICYLGFKSKYKLIQHTLQQHDIISCEECNQVIQGKDYKYHLIKGHAGTDLKIYICDTCNRQIDSKDHLIRHMKVHSGMTFSCTICKMEFKRKLALMQHTFLQHDIISCDKCNQQVKGKDHLSHFIKKHNKTKVNLYVCDVCNKPFNRRDMIIRHIFETHKNTNIQNTNYYYCNQCNKESKTVTSFHNHIRRMHDVKTLSEIYDWIKNNVNKINIDIEYRLQETVRKPTHLP